MKYEKHDLPCIRRPSASQKELRALYDKRMERERQFPGVDIDAIHRTRATAESSRSAKT